MLGTLLVMVSGSPRLAVTGGGSWATGLGGTLVYAAPRLVTDPSDCRWYHTMDLPTLGTVAGHWDLRATIDDYLGRFDGFRGNRCLDVGCASGFLTFELERRGAAEVVSVDAATSAQLEFVPFADPRFDLAARLAEAAREHQRIQDAYWLAHRLLGSRARVHYGTAYDLPAALGQFDVAVVGMLLPHVREPFRVLEQVAARTTDTIIVTQQAPQIDGAYAYFMPDQNTLDPYWAWWSLSEDCTARMLGVLGFEVVSRVRAEHAATNRGDGYTAPTEACTALVARRVRH
jgi:SAM-dependent methyltransferase